MSPRRWDTAATGLLWWAIGGLAVAWLSAAAAPSYALFRWIPNGYNEGWNAYWAEVAWHGGQLYPAVDSPVSNNYPPLSFYIVGALGSLIGDNIFAGRLLALISLLAVAVNVYAWLRINRARRPDAVFGAALFLAGFAMYAPAYMTMNDPQLLAHAVMMTSAVVLWRFGFSPRALFAAAVLMVVAGLVKHLLIALPLAVTGWIGIYRTELLVRWLITSMSLLAAAVAALYLTQGVIFFHDMASSRLYSRELLKAGIRHVRETFGFLVLLSGALGVAFVSRARGRAIREPAIREPAAFVVLYFVLAAAIGALAAGGKGVDRNAFFDLLIAASLAVALAVDHLRRLRARPMIGAVIAGVSCAVFVVMGGQQWPTRLQMLRQTHEREAAAIQVIDDIRRLGGGTAACEELSLCYWAGSAFKVDFFNFGQKLATSALPPTDCAATFTAKSISLVQVNSPPGEPRVSFRLPPSCNAAITRAYSLDVKNPQGRLMLPARESTNKTRRHPG